jgi:hypothetical protein
MYYLDEAAIASLLDPSLNSSLPPPPSQNSPTHHRIKEETPPSPSSSIYPSASNDVKPRIKTEQNVDEAYRPSEEWTKAFESLKQQHEGGEQKQSLPTDYAPSEDLLMALSSLPEGMVEMTHSSSSSSIIVQPRIKAEPRDDDDILSPTSPPSYFSKSK